MANKKVFTIPFKRKREGKTDYNARLRHLKSKKPRLVVRKSNKNIMAQLVKYDEKGDKVLFTITSKHLEKYGWKQNKGNIPSAYLVGLLIGVKAKGKDAILDIGLQSPKRGARIFAVLKGASEGGLKINFNESVVPSEDRIIGKHIKDFEKKGILEIFEKTKEKILSGK